MAIPKILATPLVTLLIVYLVICAAMWLYQRNMIYIPDVGARPPSSYGLHSVEKFVLDIRRRKARSLELEGQTRQASHSLLPR